MPVTFGLFGLGTMGSALALNLLENGVALHVANRTASVTDAFAEEARSAGLDAALTPAADLSAMIASMAPPRALILMVPAGAAVDDTLTRIVPQLSRGDIVIDAGNADFHDTIRREAALADKGLHFVGMGVSGGEEGARTGPSIMVGGPEAAWDAIRPAIEAIAARHDGTPCAARLGPDGAGHFVKTVHNGIEYADMQLIAETVGLLRNGAGWPPARIGALFESWDTGPLAGYLTQITAEILQTDEDGQPVIDLIVDSAGQKGTGRWTVIEAVRLGQSASVIEAAVAARAWSAARDLRHAAEARFAPHRRAVDLPDQAHEAALLCARLVTLVQGAGILQAGSDDLNWGLDIAQVARTWRAGCIIRSALLEDIVRSAGSAPQEGLLLAPIIADRIRTTLPALRQVTGAAIGAGHPVPALSAALAYLDTMTQARGTAALIQAQRDFFGRHGFDRVDGSDRRHGPWWN